MNIDLNKPVLLTKETLAAAIFAAAGLYWLYCGSWFLGLSGLLLGVSLGFVYKGLGFDLIDKRYRIYIGFFQWRFGTWQSLPVIVGVTVKYFSELATSGKPGRMRTDKVGCYILMLSVQQSSMGIILQEFPLNQQEYVMGLGEQIASAFRAPIHSFLSPPQLPLHK